PISRPPGRTFRDCGYCPPASPPAGPTVTTTTASKLVQTNTRPLAFQAKYCRSGSVGGVDFDVLRREIGGPHRRLGAAEPQIDREGKLAALQHGVRSLFRGWAEPGAATDYGDIAVRDRDAVRVDPGAGPPDGCHDPSPVRVRAEPGGLDQAGRGDG